MRALLFVIACSAVAACSDSQGQVRSASPVAQEAPNTSFQPAFPGQTRAPAVRSGVSLNIEDVARGLDSPWGMAFLPDGRVLVTEQIGRLRIIGRDGAIGAPIVGVPAVDARGQGGLLDVALSPAFNTDRFVFLTYSEPRGGGLSTTSVARARLSRDATSLEALTVIFRQDPPWRSRGHYGSRLVFDRAGQLFVTLGERQQPEPRLLAQDLSTHIGKVVRINPAGGAPGDNPYVGRRDARPEIWSYGHRNVQGAALHPETGALWTIEHGPQGGDELNVPRAGANYGWPVISYGEDYSGAPIGAGVAVRSGMEQPVYYWDPVIAPGGMLFYQGRLFPWAGDLLIAGLRSEQLVRLELRGERVVGEERFSLGVGRIRDVAEAADGALWIATDTGEGRILRLTPQR